MFLGKVIGTVWSTKKTPDLEGVRFLIVHPYDLDKQPTTNVVVVADRLGAVRRDGWRWNAGGALRISWNLATLLTIDYGRSREDSGLFVNFNHIF